MNIKLSAETQFWCATNTTVMSSVVLAGVELPATYTWFYFVPFSNEPVYDRLGVAQMLGACL